MTNAIERLQPVLRARALSGPRHHVSWSRTKNLMLVLLGLWLLHFLVVHLFITTLNKVTVPILGFPLGFYLAVQGSLIVFVVVLCWFARHGSALTADGIVAPPAHRIRHCHESAE